MVPCHRYAYVVVVVVAVLVTAAALAPAHGLLQSPAGNTSHATTLPLLGPSWYPAATTHTVATPGAVVAVATSGGLTVAAVVDEAAAGGGSAHTVVVYAHTTLYRGNTTTSDATATTTTTSTSGARGVWQEAATLRPRGGGAPDDQFGAAVAVSAGGGIIAVGAPGVGSGGPGRVYVFAQSHAGNASAWQQVAAVVAAGGGGSEDGLGWGVGATGSGLVMVVTRLPTTPAAAAVTLFAPTPAGAPPVSATWVEVWTHAPGVAVVAASVGGNVLVYLTATHVVVCASDTPGDPAGGTWGVRSSTPVAGAASVAVSPVPPHTPAATDTHLFIVGCTTCGVDGSGTATTYATNATATGVVEVATMAPHGGGTTAAARDFGCSVGIDSATGAAVAGAPLADTGDATR